MVKIQSAISTDSMQEIFSSLIKGEDVTGKDGVMETVRNDIKGRELEQSLDGDSYEKLTEFANIYSPDGLTDRLEEKICEILAETVGTEAIKDVSFEKADEVWYDLTVEIDVDLERTVKDAMLHGLGDGEQEKSTPDNIVLKFDTLEENAKIKHGEFEISGLNVSEKGEITFDDIDLILDGEKYEGGICRWNGTSMNTDDLFQSVLNGYLREDSTFSYSDNWETAFQNILNMREKENGLTTKLPTIDWDMEVNMLYLEMAVKEGENVSKYYADKYFDQLLLLRADNSVATDIEAFWDGAMCADGEKVNSGEAELLYATDKTRDYIKFLEKPDTEKPKKKENSMDRE